jgi:hypothetical protein
MKFEIFGNSHAAILTGAPPSGNIVPKSKEKPRGPGFTQPHPSLPFRTWFLGPVLAYNFYENHLHKIYSHIKENPDKFDEQTMILLQVGEIDCRAHLPKYVNLNTSVEHVVRQCIDRYHRSISELVEKGYKVGVLGVIPSQSDEKIKSILSGSELASNLSGNTNLRRDICLEWERYHSSICKNQSIPYISIYEKLTDKDRLAIEDFYVDSIHLSHDKTINLWIQSFKDANLM